MKPLWLLVVFILFTSCKTILISELSPSGKNAELLPPLNAVLDESSFGSAFGLTKTSSVGGVYSFNSRYAIASSQSTTYGNPNLQHVYTIYTRDIENISQSYGDRKGNAVCRLIVGSTEPCGYGWAVLSGMTLLVPNLLGMPFGNCKTVMQIEVSIYTNGGKLAGKYLSSPRTSKVPLALWHGYSPNSAEMKTIIDAFKESMSDIKYAVSQDNRRLQAELQ